MTYEAPDEAPKPALSSASRSKPKKPAQEAAAAPKVIAPAVPAAAPAPAMAQPKSEPKSEPKPEAKPQQPRPAREQKPRTDRKPQQSRAPKAPAERREQPAPKAPVEPKVYAPAEPGSVEEKIEQFIKGLLEHMGSDAVPHAVKAADETYAVDLVGENLGILIGRRGETLDAIQHLTNYAVNRGQTKRVRINVDAENYRLKREESLQRLAVKVAGKVVKYRRNITLHRHRAQPPHCRGLQPLQAGGRLRGIIQHRPADRKLLCGPFSRFLGRRRDNSGGESTRPGSAGKFFAIFTKYSKVGY